MAGCGRNSRGSGGNQEISGGTGSGYHTEVFGAESAKDVAAHAREIKAAGAVYCDCPACAAAEAILEKKDMLLAE